MIHKHTKTIHNDFMIFRMSLSDSSDSESSGSDQNQDQDPNQSLPSSIEDDNPDDENFGTTLIPLNRR